MSGNFILPSNASYEEFPDNTASTYKVKLPERLGYERGKWEIALRAITYHNNWYNVKDAYVKVYYRDADRKKKTTTVKFPDGRYYDQVSVLIKLHAALAGANMTDFFKIEYSIVYIRPFLSFSRSEYGVQFSPDLADFLGFVPGKVYRKRRYNGIILAPNEPHVNTAYEHLYVYCNLCADRVVGDSMVPCLYAVPVKWSDESTELMHKVIDEPMYVPVAGVDTDIVEIDIRRRDGQPVQFKGGNVIVAIEVRAI